MDFATFALNKLTNGAVLAQEAEEVKEVEEAEEEEGTPSEEVAVKKTVKRTRSK